MRFPKLDKNQPQTRRTLTIVLALPVLIYTWWGFAANVVAPALQPWPGTAKLWPASAGWVAARLALEGHPELIYSDDAFGRASLRLGTEHDTFAANLPTTALIYLPLALLPVGVAFPLWTFISIAALVTAWCGLLWALRIGLPQALVLTVLVPVFEPLRELVTYGQAYSLLLLLIVVAGLEMARHANPLLEGKSAGSSRKWQALAGFAIGLACIVRFYYGAVMLLPAIVRRQWRVVAAATVTFGLAAVITIASWGPDLWATAISLSLTWRDRPSTAVAAYQSLYSFLVHIFGYDPSFNPRPIAQLPGLVGPLWWVLAVALLAASVVALLRNRILTELSASQRLLPFALTITLALLLAPTNVDYHFTLMLLPLVVATAVLQDVKATFLPWVVLAACAILVGGPWLRIYNVQSAAGWEGLLHYPRLYGILLLWGLLVWLQVGRAHTKNFDLPIPAQKGVTAVEVC